MKIWKWCWFIGAVIVLASPVAAQTPSKQAANEISVAKAKARVIEAKQLIQEKEKLQQRIAEIDKRLKDLDDGAEPAASSCCSCCYPIFTVPPQPVTTFSPLIDIIPGCGPLTSCIVGSGTVTSTGSITILQ